MKTNGIFSTAFAAATLLAAATGDARAETATNYVAHEWGTFTSVQGGDGNPLYWQPLLTSELPGFVYNWNKPGLNRGRMIGNKGSMVTLQRMETPVIYFYSKQPVQVDVTVDFPKGFITEWYPQASQIGPSYQIDTNGPTDTVLGQSRAVWKNLLVTPEALIQPQLPVDNSGSHYFAARKTRADLVQTSTGTAKSTETDKFIFYRGAGSFATPLKVSVDTNNLVTVANTGSESLAHLFLVRIHDGKGAFAVLDELRGSNSIPWLSLASLAGNDWKHYPLAQFQTEIGAQVEAALVSEGLFADEARAMVNTWRDSWFTEEGERVLYILPRTWTDEILPTTFNPKPETLVRVMVGRAEILTPDSEAKLSVALLSAQHDAASAQALASEQLKRFGRFAQPALQLALKDITETNALNLAGELMTQQFQPTPQKGAR